jgi:hypothetical protein
VPVRNIRDKVSVQNNSRYSQRITLNLQSPLRTELTMRDSEVPGVLDRDNQLELKPMHTSVSVVSPDG